MTTILNARYPGIIEALAHLPDETVIDGEVVALDGEGKPSFNILQNFSSGKAPLHFYVFDLLILAGKDVMDKPLVERRALREARVLPKVTEPIRYSPVLKASLCMIIWLANIRRIWLVVQNQTFR
jgi:ATP-dependent DNA ligase